MGFSQINIKEYTNINLKPASVSAQSQKLSQENINLKMK
jgi:hypothetical protein